MTPQKIETGQVWVSPDTGNRWLVDYIFRGDDPLNYKVRLIRLPRSGESVIPAWDDGLYIWHPGAFHGMKLEGTPRTERCNKCQDRPGYNGLGRTCKGCNGTGDVVVGKW